MSSGSAVLLGVVLGAVVAAALLTVLAFRKRLAAMDRRLHALQHAKDRFSLYERVRRDRSVLELLRALLELNELLRRPSREGAESPAEEPKP